MPDHREGDPSRLAKGEFARLIGVSRARVSQYIADGLPVAFDGRIDAIQGQEWIRGNLDPTHSVAAANREWADKMEKVHASVLAVPQRLRQRLPALTVDDIAEIEVELRLALDTAHFHSGAVFDDVRDK
jgi:phage terminase Nu1 subunit (DNA packaging protein)